MATSEIKYRKLEQNDTDIINDMILDVFISSEITCVNLKMDGHRDGRPYAERAIVRGLRDGVSVVAVDNQSGQIVGFMLNNIEDKATYNDELQEELADTNDKLEDYEIMLEQVAGKIDYFERYEVDKIFNFHILLVLPGYQKRGIAKSLLCQSIQLWEDTVVPLGKVVTSGFYSRRLFESFGFDKLAEKGYDEIMHHGKPFIVGEKLHKLSIWTKKLAVQ